MPNPNLTFEGLPVKEAKRALKLHPIVADKKKAKRGDPKCCVAAQCVKRSFPVDDVRIFRSRALVKPAGKNHWVRYVMPANLSQEALVFDRGGDFQGKEFILGPLPYSATREYREKLEKRTGTHENTGKKKVRKRTPSAMTELRGSPHFKTAA